MDWTRIRRADQQHLYRTYHGSGMKVGWRDDKRGSHELFQHWEAEAEAMNGTSGGGAGPRAVIGFF